MDKVDVAIIGGGFSGAMVAAQLLRRAPSGFSLALVEKSPRLGRGAAYGPEDPIYLLNVPAGRMSAFPDDPEHFLRWYRRNEGAAGRGSFLPRAAYGRYVEAVLEGAETPARGVRFWRVTGEATGLAPRGRGFDVELRDGRRLTAGRVVLALGNFPPAPMPGVRRLDGRWIGDPWSPGAFDAIGGRDPVVIVGAGLTMADVVVGLEARGHRGTIDVVSRHGLRPLEHGARPTRPLAPPAAGRLRDLLRRLRAAARERGWREAVDSIRRGSAALWRGFSDEDRRRFLRHLRAYWEIHRHRVPPSVGRTLRRLEAAGRLRLHAGRVAAVRARAGHVRVELRRAGRVRALRGRWAINCTGPRADPRAIESPLVRELLRRGLARAHPLGLGFDVEPDGALRDRRGRRDERLWAVGPARRGEAWESVAVPELRVQAEDVARRLTTSRAPTRRGPTREAPGARARRR